MLLSSFCAYRLGQWRRRQRCRQQQHHQLHQGCVKEEEEKRGREVKADNINEKNNQMQQKSWHNNNTSINHDSAVSGDGDADFERDVDGEDLDNNIDLFEEQRYKKTNKNNWRYGARVHQKPEYRSSKP